MILCTRLPAWWWFKVGS